MGYLHFYAPGDLRTKRAWTKHQDAVIAAHQ